MSNRDNRLTHLNQTLHVSGTAQPFSARCDSGRSNGVAQRRSRRLRQPDAARSATVPRVEATTHSRHFRSNIPMFPLRANSRSSSIPSDSHTVSTLRRVPLADKTLPVALKSRLVFNSATLPLVKYRRASRRRTRHERKGSCCATNSCN